MISRIFQPTDGAIAGFLANMCRACHITDMKTISIRELHAATGKNVRAALHEPVVITERGKRLAVIKPFSAEDLAGVPFPKRRAEALPAIGVDTTVLIREERNAR